MVFDGVVCTQIVIKMAPQGVTTGLALELTRYTGVETDLLNLLCKAKLVQNKYFEQCNWQEETEHRKNNI